MLHVHRAERADALVEALGEMVADARDDPFAPDVVAVPTRGMERWLTQRMSSHLGATPGRADGVCANVAFPSPARLAGDAVAVAAGIDPDTDPWLPERAVWPLIEIVDGSLSDPWLRPLAEHLGATDGEPDDLRRTRRFSTVRHLAELYDRYALHRPDMLRAWSAGDDDRWQAELWRRLRARITTPSPAERVLDACTRLRAEPGVVDLPERLSLFGLTRLPAAHLDVLRAIAAGRDVHLFLLHPSPALWDRLSAELGDGLHVVRRADDETALLTRNRLLASWGRDAREMQLVLAGPADEPIADHHHPVDHRDGTLLARIQADVRGDVPPAASEPLALDATDDSVQIHACHGRARQVEVVRDVILHLLAEDESLEPRDVIVMCPDIETFAPLIHATFGAGQELDEDDEELEALPDELRPPDLRVRLADRSLRQTNPLLGVVAELVDLASERLTASQVLDLADREPVRRRFRFDDDDLARLRDWVAESGIRWGLDAAHRAPFKLDVLAHGTWRSGLDRVLVGVAMADEDQRLFSGVLPVDDVESGAIDLAGRFAEFVDRLRAAVDELNAAKPVAGWMEAVAAAADALTATRPRDAWQRAELGRIVDDVAQEATAAAASGATTLELPEIRALLAARLQGRPTRANFRTGHLTVCTLMPMRSVPHRVVCLLGLDDAMFPRKAPRDGDDLLLEDPHVGDRDPRSEDRQLLLDALLAATDNLVVTYTGNDERTNAERPPAVPVGELLDVVDRTARVASGRASDAVVVRHPLQPFDPRNFTPGALGAADGPWSLDRASLAGARALAGSRAEPEAFLAEPLDPPPMPVVDVGDLVRFVQHPVRAFLRGRLGVSVGDFSDELDDALPVKLDGLETWDVGERLLQAMLSGADSRTACLAEIARGHLPPGVLGKRVIEEVLPPVEQILGTVHQALGTADPGSVDVRVELGDGQILHGTIPGVCDDVVRSVGYSRVGPKHRLAAWVRLLALTAADPDRAFRAVVVGRARYGAGHHAAVTTATIPPLAADAATRRTVALRELGTLVDLYRRALCEPPPLYCQTSAAYAAAARVGRDASRAAAGAWESGWGFDKEDKEPEHTLVLGGVRTFAELRSEPPRTDEHGGGWDPTEPSRVGRWARRLWDPLLDREEVADR